MLGVGDPSGEKVIRLVISELWNENSPLRSSLVQFSVRTMSAGSAVKAAWLYTGLV